MARELENRGYTVVSVARNGGVLYVITNILIWAIQHLVPGSRATWRSPRTAAAYSREGLLAFLTFPLVLFSWVAIAVDSLLPEFGCYMGALIFSQTATNQRLSGVQTECGHRAETDHQVRRPGAASPPAQTHGAGRRVEVGDRYRLNVAASKPNR
jgi:hypothetical protein